MNLKGSQHQACAYKLFSHGLYLVIPRQFQKEEISRLDSLCQIFGIGLVTFDAETPPTHPDLFFTNKNTGLVGAFGFGAAGAAAGECAGTAAYDFVTHFEWTRY